MQKTRIINSNKFHKEDSKFLQERIAFANSINAADLYEYIDQFSIYAGPQTIANKLFMYELLKRTLNIPGHIVEFGVWKGANISFMAKILREMQPNSHKKIIGFDNFEGLPKPTINDGKSARHFIGHYRGNLEILLKAIALFELEEWIQLVIGDATSTISDFESAHPETLISLAYIDFDLYEPVKEALNFLSRRLAIGGIIAFDEGISSLWPGETIAMLEFLNSNSSTKFKMETNSLSRQPTVLLIRES